MAGTTAAPARNLRLLVIFYLLLLLDGQSGVVGKRLEQPRIVQDEAILVELDHPLEAAVAALVAKDALAKERVELLDGDGLECIERDPGHVEVPRNAGLERRAANRQRVGEGRSRKVDVDAAPKPGQRAALAVVPRPLAIRAKREAAPVGAVDRDAAEDPVMGECDFVVGAVARTRTRTDQDAAGDDAVQSLVEVEMLPSLPVERLPPDRASGHVLVPVDVAG